MGKSSGSLISLGEETSKVGEGEGRTSSGRGVDVGSTKVARLPGARGPPGARPGGRGEGRRVTWAAEETGCCRTWAVEAEIGVVCKTWLLA